VNFVRCYLPILATFKIHCMKHLLFFVLICIAFSTQAQYKLVFNNADNSKTIIVKQKDLTRLSYDGYMHQPQEVEGNVSAITDSSISLSPHKKFLQKREPVQTVLIRDISGFRRYSKFRPGTQIIYAVASVGVTGAVSALISDVSTSFIAVLLSSAATGAVTTSMNSVFFNHKIKNYLAKGWSMRLVQDSIQVK
jgi:hypothetical protein